MAVLEMEAYVKADKLSFLLIFQNPFYLLLKGLVEGGRFLHIYSLQLDRV